MPHFSVLLTSLCCICWNCSIAAYFTPVLQHLTVLAFKPLYEMYIGRQSNHSDWFYCRYYYSW